MTGHGVQLRLAELPLDPRELCQLSILARGACTPSFASTRSSAKPPRRQFASCGWASTPEDYRAMTWTLADPGLPPLPDGQAPTMPGSEAEAAELLDSYLTAQLDRVAAAARGAGERADWRAQLARSRRAKPRNRMDKRLRVPHPLEDRDLVDLRRLQVVPEDPPRAVVGSLDLDHRARGRDQVDRAGRGRSPAGSRAGSGSGDRWWRRRCGRRSSPPRSAARTRCPRTRRPCRSGPP